MAAAKKNAPEGLDAFADLLDDDLLKVIESTPVEQMRRRLPFFNSEECRTEDIKTRQSDGHIVRILDWVPSFTSKKGGKDTTYEKVEVEIIEPDPSQGASCVPGDKFVILMPRGSEREDKRAAQVRGGMMHAIAACFNEGKQMDPQDAKVAAAKALSALKSGKMPEEMQQRLLARAHVRFDRRGTGTVVEVNEAKRGSLAPVTGETLGEYIKIAPGDPSRNQYGGYYYHVELAVV